MRYRQRKGEVELSDVRDFDLVRIFECGQCFRWNSDEYGVYSGVALGYAAKIRRENDSIFISGSVADFESIWRDYFDLDRDYEEIRKMLCIDEYMCAAVNFGAGLRILRQEKWEALCSFIISQCNNIPRIKKIIDALCRAFGEEIYLGGETYYAFPKPEILAEQSINDLSFLRCGYRAAYIIEAAKAVHSGILDLNRLAELNVSDSLNALKALKGVGDKVANCIVLFGLSKLDAFPVDVWMKKTIAEHYDKDFDPKIFGSYAGIAQQYMFYYARSGFNKH